MEGIFNNLPNPVEWRSFFNHGLLLLMDFCEEVRDVSIRQLLNRSQTRALEKLKSASMQDFQRVTADVQRSPNLGTGYVGRDSSHIDLSGREIEELADKAARKESSSELKRPRVRPLSLEAKIFMMSRLGIPANRIDN